MSRIPFGTYRIQLHKDFTFDDASALAGYFQQLGISHVYCSPYLQAAPNSKHGYDVVDHHHVNQELGGEEAHERFCNQLGRFGLGQVLDIVPNHMAIAGQRNRYWWDVLENGPASVYASYFDIDWHPSEKKLRNKVLVPVLGDHYGRVLARHEVCVKRRGGNFFVDYFDNSLPAAPRSLDSVLAGAAQRINSDYLAFLGDSYHNLPVSTETDRESLAARHRDKEVIRALLGRFCNESAGAASAIDAELEKLNADVDALDAFLERQNFRLSFWKTAGEELMYRRFFDVNTLVGLRMESETVFKDTHSLILDWLQRGILDGIRIDHPDGLRDPDQYFHRLRSATPEGWILGEKILEPGEPLRKNWPIDGTTGYDFLNQAGGLFISPEGLEKITGFYQEFTGENTSYEDMCHEKKLLVMRDILGSDVNRLVTLFSEICENQRNHRDYTRTEIHRAIREVTACFPVYRTFLVSGMKEINPIDQHYIDEAITKAKKHREDVDPDLFDFIRDVLLLKYPGELENEFVMRFQQFTGPAMAKGVEDTTFYCYNRLISANEVGGDPGKPTISVSEFHQHCEEVQQDWPLTMLATSTHDTKRSEDLRARISLLSEMPEEWAEAVQRWSALNKQFKSGDYPDPNTEYLLYQTMMGAWPISAERLQQYMEKATRESKRITSWISPDEAFDKALQNFIEQVSKHEPFLQDLEKFVHPLIVPGRVSSLAQVLLKMTAPGIPDLYQGSEIWDLSLVDPDNRRPVDYDLRRRLLAELPSLNAESIWQRQEEGLPKLWLIHQCLLTRREHGRYFGKEGNYARLNAKGRAADHVAAFTRGNGAVVVVPRLILNLQAQWADTSIDLPEGRWKNQFTNEVFEGGEKRIADLFAKFPVSLLVRER